jgi:hypothetical protein
MPCLSAKTNAVVKRRRQVMMFRSRKPLKAICFARSHKSAIGHGGVPLSQSPYFTLKDSQGRNP